MMYSMEFTWESQSVKKDIERRNPSGQGEMRGKMINNFHLINVASINYVKFLINVNGAGTCYWWENFV